MFNLKTKVFSLAYHAYHAKHPQLRAERWWHENAVRESVRRRTYQFKSTLQPDCTIH